MLDYLANQLELALKLMLQTMLQTKPVLSYCAVVVLVQPLSHHQKSVRPPHMSPACLTECMRAKLHACIFFFFFFFFFLL